MDIIKALSPFPGFGSTGKICGAVSGGLVVLGLYFGSEDMTDYEKISAAMNATRKFLPRFEEVLGSLQCAEIQEDVVFGRFMNTRASEENRKAFIEAKGYAKCALPAGIGARLAAEIIIESMKQE